MPNIKEIDAIVIQIDIQKGNRDLVFQNELFISLIDRTEILGFYCALEWCAMTGIIESCPTQRQLAKVMGLTEPTFIQRRKTLEKIGLLEVIARGTQREFKFKAFERLPGIKPPKNFKEVPAVIGKAKEQLKFGDESTPNGQLALADKTPREKIVTQSFPRVNYEMVLGGYQKYKGVKLQGPEVNRAMREIKQMFLAGHSVNDILSCMKWFAENADGEETKWAKFWILSTVMKKLPEFKAGKLAVKKLGDDLEYFTVSKK